VRISFEGIGQWAATFACDETVQEGQIVKAGGNRKVTACVDGDGFCGVAAVVGGSTACAVIMGGMVTVSYSGSVPGLGWSGLSADGAGGVKADAAGRKFAVVDVDTAGKMVTFVL
jgi:hypothetical protein